MMSATKTHSQEQELKTTASLLTKDLITPQGIRNKD